MAVWAIKARWVVPVDGPPLEGATVVVDGPRIAAVGANVYSPPPVDLGEAALLPGLVNAHTHLEFSDLCRPLGSPGMALTDWIRLVLAHRGRSGRQAAPGPSPPLRTGLDESLRAGATTIGDIAAGGPDEYPSDLRIAAVTAHFEAIGFSQPRSQSAGTAVLARLDAPGPPGLRRGLSPHAPYTVHPELLARLVRLSAERRLPLAFHLAESREELRLLADNDGPFQELLDERSMWDAGAIGGGRRALDYLHVLAGCHRGLVVHGNYLTDEELDFLAQRATNLSLVFCPRTHAFFRHERYPLQRALANGVRVALGTDSRASNPDLDMLAELRLASESFPEVAPADLVRAASLSGATALGLEQYVGSITPGKRANLVAVGLSDPAAADPYGFLSDARPGVRHVWLGGEPVL